MSFLAELTPPIPVPVHPFHDRPCRSSIRRRLDARQRHLHDLPVRFLDYLRQLGALGRDGDLGSQARGHRG